MLRHDYKNKFDQLAKEFDNKLNIEIAPLRIDSEPSRILSRLIHLCGDAKEPLFEKRRYHLCRHIEKSLNPLEKPESKKQILRTRNLLAEDDLFSITRLVGITEKEFVDGDEAILDLRANTLLYNKIKLNEDFLAKQIATLFLTDDYFTVFTKNDKRISPINGATVRDIIKDDINLSSFLEYVKLCHQLENNPLLLDLDIQFFNDLNQISKDLLNTPDGIIILNTFGYDNLIKNDGLIRLKKFKELIQSIPHGIIILEKYGQMITQASAEYIQLHHETLFKALNDSDLMISLLYSPDFFESVKVVHGNDFIKKYITQATLLKELKNYPQKSNQQKEVIKAIITAELATNGLTDRKWLDLFIAIKDQADIYQWVVKQYIEKNRLNTTLEESIMSVDPDIQIELFELLESQQIELNYFTLSKSDTLKKFPKIKDFIETQKATALEQLLTRFVFEERDEKELIEAKNQFKMPEPELHSPAQEIMTDVETKLNKYQKKYLILDEKGHAKSSFFTPSARAAAYNQVVPYLKDNRNDDLLKDTLLSSEFKTHLGENSYRRPLTSFQPLTTWANSRIQEQNERKTYWEHRAAICTQVKNNDILLLELLLDIDVLHHLTPDELSILFNNGNRGLFAEIIVRAYPNIELPPFNWEGMKVNMAFLKQLVPKSDNIADLNQANEFRNKYKIPQYIPIGAKYPGTSPDDAALNKEQLYQLQDQDIAVGEEILCEEFKKEIALIQFYNISKQDRENIAHYEKKSEKKENTEVEYIAIKFDKPPALDEKENVLDHNDRKVEVLDSSSSLQTVYLVPINPAQAVLVDIRKQSELKQQKNSRLWSYNEFKNKIRLAAKFLPLTNNGVIAGVCNLDGNHYVSYFIYRNKHDQFSVLTIDPSYEPSYILEVCFKDIFPGCEYNDAHAVQQIRQRDCGFNSLESIRAIAANLHSPKPIISIVEDKMCFDPSGLTVNGEPFRGRDHNRKIDYFLKEFIQQGENNRERWAKKFKKKNQVNYGTDCILIYSYDENVEGQKISDEMDDLVSVIAAYMTGAELLETYRNQYKAKLELPSPKQLEHIKEKLLQTDLTNEVLEGKAGTEAIFAIFKMNYKNDTATGLLNIFKRFLLWGGAINKDSTAENLFHEFTQTEKYIEYSKIISEAERDELRRGALVFASAKIKNETFKLKQQYIFSYIHENITALLKSIEVQQDKDLALIVDSIIVALKENRETQKDATIISEISNDLVLLQKYISKEIDQLIDKKTDYYWDFLEKNSHLLLQLIKNDYLDFTQLESMMTNPLLDEKESKAELTYTSLFQKKLIQKYPKYQSLVHEQFEIVVESVLRHPLALDYLKKLNGKTQIDLLNQDNYIGLFAELAKFTKMTLPARPNQQTYHGKMLNEIIQNKMQTYFYKNKRMTDTYGQPLTLRMLIDCLYYLRAHQQVSSSQLPDQDFSLIYFKLLELVNPISSNDLDSELSIDTIKSIKQILQVSSDFVTQVKVWSHESKLAEDFVVAALLNSKSISETRYLDKKEIPLNEPFKWNHLQFEITSDIDKLPHSTQTLAVIRDLNTAIDVIARRHRENKGNFNLDYTDIQILKVILDHYVRVKRANHNFLEPNNNTAIDYIYIKLAAFIQLNTQEATPIAQLLMPDLTVDQSLDKKPSSESVNRSSVLLSKKTGDFYTRLLRDAKDTCCENDFKKISIFVNSLKQLNYFDSNTMHANAIKWMTAYFKECIAFARETDQLAFVLNKIVKDDVSMVDTIKELYKWTQELKKSISKKTIIYQGGILLM